MLNAFIFQMLQILSLLNLVNSSAAGTPITYYLPKKAKRGRKRVILHLQLFQQVQFVNF